MEILAHLLELNVSGNVLEEFMLPRTLTRLLLAGNPILLPAVDPKSILVQLLDRDHACRMSVLDISSIKLDEVSRFLTTHTLLSVSVSDSLAHFLSVLSYHYSSLLTKCMIINIGLSVV